MPVRDELVEAISYFITRNIQLQNYKTAKDAAKVFATIAGRLPAINLCAEDAEREAAVRIRMLDLRITGGVIRTLSLISAVCCRRLAADSRWSRRISSCVTQACRSNPLNTH